MLTTRNYDLVEIAHTIWSQVLGEELTATPDQPTTVESGVTCLVPFDGAWEGALVLRCPSSLAAALTAKMFASDREPSQDDIRDALGELTNMLAGNVRALLPQPCRIGLPIVAFGNDYDVRIVGARPETSVGFRCRDLPVCVSLLHKLDSPTGESS